MPIIIMIYSFSLTSTYIYLKKSAILQALDYFTLASFIVSILLFIFPKRISYKLFFSKILLTRGIFFGLTQIFLFEALKTQETSNVLLIALFGILVSGSSSKFFLNEFFNYSHLFTLLLSFSSLFLIESNLNVTLLSFASGVVAGLAPTLTRLVLKKGFTIREMASSTFMIGSIVCFVYVLIFSNLTFENLRPARLSIVIVLIGVVQLSYCYILKKSTVPYFSVLMLSRIPFAILIEIFFLNSPFTKEKLWICILIFLGGGLPYIYDRKNIHLKKQR